MSEKINEYCSRLISGLGDIRLDYVRAVGKYFDLELVYHMGRYLVMIGNDRIMMYGIYPEVEGEGFCLVEEHGEAEVLHLMEKLMWAVLLKLEELKKEKKRQTDEVEAAIDTIGEKFGNVKIDSTW